MILVTGGTGRIGRHLLSALLAKGEKVRAIVRNEERAIYLPKGVEPFYADITKKESLLNAFKDVEKVVHLAANVDFSSDSEAMERTNVEGTRNLLESCPPSVKKFVHVSSISVYGYKLAKVPADESTACRPSGAYGRSKLRAEREALSFADKMDVVVMRLGVVYGKGFDEAYLSILEMLEQGKMPILGDGGNRIPFVHVSDVVEALVLALGKEVKSGSIFNIVGAEQLTQREVFGIACERLGVKPPKKSVPVLLAKGMALLESLEAGMRGRKPKLLGEYVDTLASDRLFDVSRAERELGFRAKVKLTDGIKEMVKYYGGDRYAK